MQRKLALTLTAAFAACAWSQPAGEVGVLKVQGNVYMLVAGGRNIAAQVGDDGILLVDTATEALAPGVAAVLKKLSAKPVLWIVNTGPDLDHMGGNAALPRLLAGAAPPRPRIVAQEKLLNRLSAAPKGSPLDVPDTLWPNDEYAGAGKDFAFNGEAVVVTHVPAAHTDGDSLVHFRRSDVLATGDVFTPGRYPVIDLQRGGTIQGLIDALNQILRITVPHYLPGQNPFLHEFADYYGLPFEATRGGKETLYPEYQEKLKNYKPPAKCERYCRCIGLFECNVSSR